MKTFMNLIGYALVIIIIFIYAASEDPIWLQKGIYIGIIFILGRNLIKDANES